MGLGLVLLFWAVIGSILAGIGAAVFGGVAAFFTRGVNQGRKRVIIAGGLFPFLCLGWGGCVFVFQAVVNEGLLHRDLGLGDTWHAPLPNGYQIMMIDVTDQGWVYNPKTQPGSAVGERDDAIAGVRTVQIAGQYILGSTDSKAFSHLGQETNTVDGYFLLDTVAGKHSTFSTFDQLRAKATELNIAPNLRPINSVYSDYRFSWFDVFAGSLFCVPPLAGVLFLVVWIRRLRRSQHMSLQPQGT